MIFWDIDLEDRNIASQKKEKKAYRSCAEIQLATIWLRTNRNKDATDSWMEQMHCMHKTARFTRKIQIQKRLRTLDSLLTLSADTMRMCGVGMTPLLSLYLFQYSIKYCTHNLYILILRLNGGSSDTAEFKSSLNNCVCCHAQSPFPPRK